jgi:L-threonylcarbamoyladenylate synthase
VSAAAIALAARALARGELVAFPTETYYGLGADARSPVALARLLAAKGREAARGISLIVDGEAGLAEVAARVPARARALIAAHWPGPLTLVLPARPELAEALRPGGWVAVRVSPHPVAQALVRALGGPVTATSANRAGEPPPTSAAAARAALGPDVLVLDGGETPGGPPSTIARVEDDGRVTVLRAGAIALRPGDDGVT